MTVATKQSFFIAYAAVRGQRTKRLPAGSRRVPIHPCCPSLIRSRPSAHPPVADARAHLDFSNNTSHGYKTVQSFQDSTARACFHRPFILRQTGPVVGNHGMQKQLLINVSAWLTVNGMKSENMQFRMLCDQSIDKTSKAIRRSMTFKLKNSLLMTLRQFKPSC